MKETIIEGKVIHGAKKGRLIGFPTANILLGDSFPQLANGVYKANITIDNTTYSGIANIGTHPTVGAFHSRLLEVNIFDFNKDIYDLVIKVNISDFIRPEFKFLSIDELKSQIEKDIEQSKL